MTCKTALVVDDDPFVREMLQIMLTANGFDVSVLQDGIEAVEIGEHYDVILLDLNMPVLDGERLAAYWTMTHPEVLSRVIILSAYPRFTGGRSIPAFAVVEKPFDYLTLMDTVRACAAQRRADRGGRESDERPESEQV